MGWPRLQPLPEKLTSSSSRPYSRHAAMGTDANASLISHSVTSEGFKPARCKHLADHLHGAEPGVARCHTGGRPGPHRRHHGQLLGVGVVTVDECHRGRGVVGAAAVARGDREAFDLRMQDLQRGQLLDGGVTARVLVDAEVDDRAVELLTFSGMISSTNLPRRSRRWRAGVTARPMRPSLAGDARPPARCSIRR